MKILTILLLLALASAQRLYNPKPSTIVPWQPHNATSVGDSTVWKHQYYLADRSNDVVHVVNISSPSHAATIGGFRGLIPRPRTTSDVKETAITNIELSGPNGVVVLPDRSELYVGRWRRYGQGDKPGKQ